MPRTNMYEVIQIRKVQVSALSPQDAIEVAQQALNDQVVTTTEGSARRVHRRWTAELSAKEI